MIWFVVIGAVLVVPGALSYAGVWRSWARSQYPAQLFGLFWLGLALVCMGIAAFFFDGPGVGLSLALVLVFILSGALGFWMVLGGAQWAKPGWYRRRMAGRR